MAKKEKPSSSGLKVDFSGVEKDIRKHSDRSVRVPEGDYVVKIVDFEVKESDKGSRYIRWKCQIVGGEFKGKTLYGMTSLKKDALWSLRNLIHAAVGKNVAGKSVNFDPSNLLTKVVGGAVEDDEYDGKVRSRINSFFPKEEVETSDDDDEEDEDDDEEEDDDEAEEEDDDEEDLEEVDTDDI